MASYRGFQNINTLQLEEWHLDGYVAILSTEAVANTGSVSTAPTDAFGQPLLFPRGISSVAKASTGVYTVTLEQPWNSVLACQVTGVAGAATAGTWKVKEFNPQSSTVGGVAAQTITLVFEQTGSAASAAGLGFFISLKLRNTNV